MESGAGSRERLRTRRSACWLGLVAFLAYLPFVHGHFAGTDEMGVFLTTRALYETGSWEVRAGPHRFQGREGRTYAHFAPALPLLALPLYALGDAAERTLPAPWLRALSGRPPETDRIDTLGSPHSFAVALYPAFASAVLVALFFAVAQRLGASVRGALAAAAVLGGASYVATHSVYFLRHTSEAITLLASFGALLAFRDEGRLRALVAASLWASLTLLVAVPATVAIPPLAAYALHLLWPRLCSAPAGARARLLGGAALPALAVLAVHVAHNHALWGTFLDSPMVAQRRGFTTPLYVGLAGFLLSPGASLFLYSPPLLLLPGMLPRFWREQRAECATVLAIALSLLLFCAGFGLWHGLWSAPGPRYLFVLTPFLLLPLGRWLDAHAGPRERRALLGLAAAGVGVQLVLVLSRWSAVIRIMDYHQSVLRSGFDFLFVPGQSPILGSARAVAAGELDAWLWGLATGFDGAGAPAAAALLLALWALALGFALSRLRRSVRG